MNTICPECGRLCEKDNLCCTDCIVAAGNLHSNAAVEFAISARGRYAHLDSDGYIAAFSAPNRVTHRTLVTWATIVVVAAVSLLFILHAERDTYYAETIPGSTTGQVNGGLAAPAGDSISSAK